MIYNYFALWPHLHLKVHSFSLVCRVTPVIFIIGMKAFHPNSIIPREMLLMNVIKLSDQRSADQYWLHHSADSTSVADLRSSTALTDTWEIGSGCHTQTVWNDKGEERRTNRWRGRKSHLAFTPAQLEQLQWAADIWRESYMSPWPSSPQLRSNYGSGREREREIEGKGFRLAHIL